MPTASMPGDTWQKQLNALADTRDAPGLQMFVAMRESEYQRRASWHICKLRFVHQHWRSSSPTALEWVRNQVGLNFWKGLTVPTAWTLDTKDDYESTRRHWHEEMLTYNDARGVFKSEPRSLEVLTARPKLSWLIAAMQAAQPRAYAALDVYRPGAFAYFEILRSTGENPMNNETFKDWILNNAHPGFAERLDDFEPSEAFGSSF